MKKMILIFASVIGLIAGCTKADIKSAEEPKGSLMVFTAGCDASRAVLQSDNSVYWSASDTIGVFGGTATNSPFHTSGTPTSTAVFTGYGDPTATQYYAYVPYSTATTFDSGTSVLTVNIPQIQSFTAGSFDPAANIAVAHSANTSLSFKNLCGMIKITVKGTAKLNALVFAGANNEVVSGSGTVDMTYSDAPQLVMHAATGETSYVGLISEEGVQLTDTGTTYYIVVPAGTYANGFKLKFYDDSGCDMIRSTTKSFTVGRAQIRNLGVFTYAAEKAVAQAPALIYYGNANTLLLNNEATSGTLDATPHVTDVMDCWPQTSSLPVDDAPIPVSAKIVWRESGLTFDYSFSGTTLSITNASGYGNAMVAVLDADNNIVWSFQIWRPEDDATVTKTYSNTRSGSVYNVMPLNLGATKVVTADAVDADKVKAMGEFYEWGRKDPMGRLASFADTTLVALVKDNGSAFDWHSECVVSQKAAIPVVGATSTIDSLFAALDYIKAHPNKYLRTDSYMQEWSYTAIPWLWGNTTWDNSSPYLVNTYPYTLNTTIKKSVFDPCPAGYRVPCRDLWTNFITTSSVYSVNSADSINSSDINNLATLKGATFYYSGSKNDSGNTNKDFYISTGTINPYGAYVLYSGTSPNYYWASELGGLMDFSTSSFMYTPYYVRSFGAQIRCVAEP